MDEQSLFTEALEKQGPAERAVFLAEACADNSALRKRVERLLEKHAQAGSFLETPGTALLTSDGRGNLAPGAVGPSWEGLFGDYEVLGEIARGGMGVIYRARQVSVNRPVALKMILAGQLADDKEVQRFRAEAETLANLDHPHIVPIYEVGEVHGQHYFSMKLIEGQSLNERLAAHGSDHRAVARLMVSVADAVHHAHQRGILHRDLKPSNILVDSQGQPHVTDFGLARKIEQPEGLTRTGTIVGTPEYIAPEQAAGGKDLSTAGDVYSLGAILYTLLVGSPPFQGDHFLATLRQVIETDPLPPRSRNGAIPRDLEIICLKCLTKEPGRRYPSAHALAEDLQRYLSHEPILASPPSATYRLRKFLRRHRWPVAVAVLMFTLLVAGLVGTTLGLMRALNAEQDALHQQHSAEEQAAISRAVNEFFQNLLGQADVGNQSSRGGGRDPDVKVRTLLDRAAKTLDGKFANQPVTEAAIRWTVGNTYRALGEYQEARRHLQRSVDLRTARLGNEHPDTLTSKHDLADLYREQGKYDDSEELFHEVIRARQRRLGEDHADTLTSKNSLAVAYWEHGKWSKAKALFLKVLQVREAQLGPEQLDTLRTKHHLAVLYRNLRKHEEAERLHLEVQRGFRNQLGEDHPDTLTNDYYLAELYREQGKYDEAKELCTAVLAKRRVQLGEDHPDTLQSKSLLAEILKVQGKEEEAEKLYREVLAKRLAKLGPAHHWTLQTKNNLAVLCRRQGKIDEAERLYLEILEVGPTTLSLDHPGIIQTRNNLLVLYHRQDEHIKAEAQLRALADHFKRTYGEESRQYANHLPALGTNLLRVGKPVEAEKYLRQALARLAENPPQSWSIPILQSRLGASLLEQKKYALALPLLHEGYRGLDKIRVKIPVQDRTRLLTEALEGLVRLYEAWGNKDPAEIWRQKLNDLQQLQKKTRSPGRSESPQGEGYQPRRSTPKRSGR
jgi:serine/threonine protein kinase